MFTRLLAQRTRLTIVLGLLAWAGLGGPARADFVVGDFEDQNPGSNTVKNDFRSTNNGFTTSGISLNNNFNPKFGSWSGFAVSSKVDNVFGGNDFSHEYGAYAPAGTSGTGSGGSATYGVAFNASPGDAVINLPAGTSPFSIDLTNSTYTAQSIKLGDGFARAFHGPTDTQAGDFFLLDILGMSGLNGTGTQIGDVPFYLADYRGATPILISDWTNVSLTSLAGAMSLEFSLTTTDIGQFGPNTPSFFALDNIKLAASAVPEPSALMLLAVGSLAAVARRRWRRGP